MRRRLGMALLMSAIVIGGCGNPNKSANNNSGEESMSTPEITIISQEEQDRLKEQETTTEEPTTLQLIDASKYVGINHTQPYMDNIIIDDVENLPRTRFACGNGPSVDEYSRPTEALGNMAKFAKYQSYFVRDDVTDKIMYLTFDEGYEYGCTAEILDTLKEKNVKAVFFVTMPYVKSSPELVQRMIDEGHIVGNHSVSHMSFPELSIQTQVDEVVGLHDYMQEQFNYDMWLFRYPKGEYNEQTLAVLNNLGYATIFWSFAYKDYDVNNQPNEGESLQKLLSKVHSGAIYLLHAESRTNTNILGTFIDESRAAGYTFELFDIVQENSERQ